MTLAEFAEQHKLKFRWRRGRTPKKIPIAPGSRFFICKIIVGGHRGKQITVPYEMTIEKHGDPRLLDVLRHARGVAVVATDLHRFCAVYGFDPKDVKAADLWRLASKMNNDLRRAFRYAAIRDLFECE